MHDLILWCGFLGSWLLVAGPVYQAVIELRAEEIERERIREVTSGVSRPPRVSAWWWLMPPVRWVLVRRRREQHQEMMLDALSDEDYEALIRYLHKATGWVFVGAGGFLIAVTETYGLVEGLQWPLVVFWILLVVMAGLSIGNAVAREARTERTRQRRIGMHQPEEAAPDGAAPP